MYSSSTTNPIFTHNLTTSSNFAEYEKTLDPKDYSSEKIIALQKEVDELEEKLVLAS